MDPTPRDKKNRKTNWKYVEPAERDFRLFETIHLQGFIRREHAIEYIFRGNKSYAIRRIWKLKTFGYLKAIKMKDGHSESYVLGQDGVEALRGKYPEGIGGCRIPDARVFIDPGAYEHDWTVTQVRFFLEGIGFGGWKSEKELKASCNRHRKVPDGFVNCAFGGVAIEVEINRKKARTYHKIFNAYFRDQGVQYVLYFCKNVSLMRFILKCARDCERGWLDQSSKKYPKAIMCVLLAEIRTHKENAIIHTNRGNLTFKEALES